MSEDTGTRDPLVGPVSLVVGIGLSFLIFGGRFVRGWKTTRRVGP
jgi:hypothetical protein